MAEWKTLKAIYENGHVGQKRWAANPNWFMVADAMTAEAEAYRVDLSAFEDSQRKRIFEGDLRGLFNAWAEAVGWNYVFSDGLAEDEITGSFSFAPDPHSWAAGMRKDLSRQYKADMNDKKSGPIPGREAVTIHRWAIAVWDALKVADPYILPTEPTATAAPAQEPAVPAPTKATPWRVLLRDSYGPFAEQIITAFEIAVKRGIATEEADGTRLFWHGASTQLLAYFCAMAAGGDTGTEKVTGREYLIKEDFKGKVFGRIWGVEGLNGTVSKMRVGGEDNLPVKGRTEIDEIVDLTERP